MIVMLRGILHRSVRVVPMHTDARYIPTGKPVELRAQKLAAKRLPRKKYCTAGDQKHRRYNISFSEALAK